MVDLCARLPANEGREPELPSHRTSAAVDAALTRGFDQARSSPNGTELYSMPPPKTAPPACPLTCAPTSVDSAQPLRKAPPEGFDSCPTGNQQKPVKAPPVGFDSCPPGNQQNPVKYKAAPAPMVSERMKPPPPAPPKVDVPKPPPPTKDAPKPSPPVTDVPKPSPPMVDVPKHQPHMAAVSKPPPRTLDSPMAGGQPPMQPKKSAPKCPSIY